MTKVADGYVAFASFDTGSSTSSAIVGMQKEKASNKASDFAAKESGIGQELT